MARFRSPHYCRFFLTGMLVLGACGCHTRGQKSPEAAVTLGASGSAEQLTEQGRAALARGDATRAEQYFTLALEEGGAEKGLVLLLVRTCLAQTRLRAALNYAEPYLIEAPEDLPLRYLVATIHFSLGHSDEARRQLSIILHHAPHYPDAHFLMGVMHQGEQDAVAARHAFDRYLALAPRGEHAAETKSHLVNLSLVAREDAPREVHGFTTVPRPPAGSEVVTDEPYSTHEPRPTDQSQRTIGGGEQ